MDLQNILLPENWLDQCLKSLISKHPSKNIIVNAPKLC